jgi:hypothetical protein
MDDHAGWLIGAADEEVADRGGVDGPGWAFEAGADIGGSELAGSDQDRDVMSGASQDVGSLVGGHHINSGSHVDHAPILGMIIEGFVVCFDVGLADSGEVVFVDDEEGAVLPFSRRMTRGVWPVLAALALVASQRERAVQRARSLDSM